MISVRQNFAKLTQKFLEHLGDISGVPLADVLVESAGAGEHAAHVGDLVTRKLRCNNFWAKISRIELIRYDLESGERDLSDGDVGFRVNDLQSDFWIRVKDFKMRFQVRVKDFDFQQL